MRSSDLTELRTLDLFKDMEQANFDLLMRGGYVQNFPPQVDLVSEGDPSDFLHVVVEGSVELFASWNRHETTMSIARPVSTFILAAAIQDAPYLMSARTLEKSRVVLLPSINVRAIFETDHAFARAVVTELAQCYRSVLKDAKNLKLRSSIERLANFLLKTQIIAGGGEQFELGLEKRRLASRLGMTPENLSRAIKALVPYGVKVNGSQVEISNNSDLKGLAKPTLLIDDPSS